MTTPTPPLPIPTVDYSSRDYASIRDDLLNNVAPALMPEWTSRSASDFGVLLTELFAYVGDGAHYYLDRIANEAFLSTATQRSSVLRIANQLGYVPDGQLASTASVTFTNTDTVNPVTIPAGTQVGTSTDTAQQVVFEVNTTTTVAASGTASVVVTQGETVSLEALAGSSAGTPEQSYTLFFSPVVQGPNPSSQVTVIVNSVAWSYIPHIYSAGPLDQVFSLSIDENSYVSVIFGDGVNGLVPPSGASIKATYRVGGGVIGNVPAGTITSLISSITGGGSLSLTNALEASGGADAESTNSIRVNAAKSLNVLQRAVSLSDYPKVAVTYPGVSKANAISTTRTAVDLYIAETGPSDVNMDGSPSSALATLFTGLATFLEAATPVDVTVTLHPPVYVPVYVTALLHLAPQFSQSRSIALAQNALQDLLSFDNVVFGDTITPTDVHVALNTVPGMVWADLTFLSNDGETNSTALSFGANQIPSPVLANLVITATGGIADL